MRERILRRWAVEEEASVRRPLNGSSAAAAR